MELRSYYEMGIAAKLQSLNSVEDLIKIDGAWQSVAEIRVYFT
jgi:hypothetical protein